MNGGDDDDDDYDSKYVIEVEIDFNRDAKYRRVLFIVSCILIIIIVVLVIIRIGQVVYWKYKTKEITEKYQRTEKKIAKYEKKLGVESYHAKEESPKTAIVNQQIKDIFKPLTTKEKIKQIAPEVAEIGLNLAEKYSLIDLADKNLMNEIIRKASN
jgi:Tfp pilus assembly protein PilO